MSKIATQDLKEIIRIGYYRCKCLNICISVFNYIIFNYFCIEKIELHLEENTKEYGGNSCDFEFGGFCNVLGNRSMPFMYYINI